MLMKFVVGFSKKINAREFFATIPPAVCIYGTVVPNGAGMQRHNSAR